MKIKPILILSLLFIFSCQNDDVNPSQQPEPHPIEGKWSLLSEKPNFGDPTIFAVGEVIWEFKKQNKIQRTINIELTNYNIARLYPYHVPGEQLYHLAGEEYVVFDLDYMPEGQNQRVYPYFIEGDTLIMGDYSASDASSIFKFSRF
jgi:hypothetical protein